MRRVLVLLSLFLFTSSLPAQAHAPINVQVSYDHQTQQLTVEMDHMVTNFNQHFIRLIDITDGTNSLKKVRYLRQNTRKGFSQTIPIALESGQTIHLNIYCEKGGVNHATFTVPVVEEVDEKVNSD